MSDPSGIPNAAPQEPSRPRSQTCDCGTPAGSFASCGLPRDEKESPDPRLAQRFRRRRILWHLALSLAGMLLTGGAFHHEHQERIQQAAREFALDATRHAIKVADTLEQRQIGLRVLQELLASSTHVEEESFRRIALTLRKMHGDILALAWISLAPQDLRPSPGAVSPPAYPVKWVEPNEGMGLYPGFDLSTLPSYSDVLEQSARENIALSPSFAHISQEIGGKAGLPIFLPVFSASHDQTGKSLRGFVLGILRLPDLLAAVVRTNDERMLVTTLREAGPPDQAQRRLAHWRAPSSHQGGETPWHWLSLPPVQKIWHPVHLFGRDLTVEVVSTPAWIEHHFSRSYWFMLPVGVALTLLLMLYADSVLLFRVRSEALVRKRTTELEANRRRLELAQFVMDHAGDLVLWLDQEGRIVYVNTTACRVLDYTEEVLLTLHLRDLAQEISPARWEEIWKDCQPGRQMLLETTLHDSQGIGHPMEISLNGLFCCDTPYLIAVTRDISERRRAQHALRESEQKFRTMADFTHDWEYWVAPDGGILYISPSCETITGYPREAFLADKSLLLRLVHPDDRATYRDHMADFANPVQKRLGVTTLRFRIIAREGETRWIEHSCRPVHGEDGTFLGRRVSNRDVTARVIAVEALRRERDFIRQMVNSLPGILYLLDTQGRLQLWNDELIRVTGIPEEALPRKDVLEFFEGADRALIERRIRQIFNEGRGTAEANLLSAGGESIPYLFTGMRIQMDDRLMLVGMGLDISEHKRLEESLRESELRSRSTVAALAEGIVLRDAAGRILTCNAAAERLLGESHATLVGRELSSPDWRYISPVGRPLALEEHPAHATLQDGQPRQEVVIGIQRPDQEVTWISVNTQPLIRPGADRPYAVVSSFSDITLKRRSEEMLACVRRVQFHFLEEQDPHVLFDNLLLDVLRLTRSQYGFISSWEVSEQAGDPPCQQCLAISNISWDEASSRFYEENAHKSMHFHGERGLHMAAVLTGQPVLTDAPTEHPYAKGLPPGHPPLESFMGVPLTLGERLVGQIGLANRPGGYDYELLEFLEPVFTAAAQIIDRHRERQRRHIAEEEIRRLNRELEDRVQARTRELVASHDNLVQEVEQRRLTETALREAQQHLEQQQEQISTILDAVPAMIFFKDDQNRMIRVNDGFLRNSGLPREMIEGRSLFEIMQDKELAERYWQDDLEVIRSGQPKLGIIEELVTDRNRWYQTDKIPYRDRQDRVVGVIGFAVEITERLEAERLRQESIRIEAASRAKSEFLANVSHEIRTPMNSIVGMADLLAEAPLEEPLGRYVQTIQSAGETLLSIINDVLDMSKIESGRLDLESAPFSLHKTVEDVRLIMGQRIAQKNLTLTVTFDPALPDWWVGDPVRLRQILLNLLGNSVKFTERGGISLEITTQPTSHPDTPPMLHFLVQDTGIGITAEQQEVIFERFMQSDPTITRRFGGTGLGLAISRRLVELMGGTIGVESILGQGSRFYFTLALEPCSAPVEEAETLLESAHPASDRRPLRILVVDDAEENRMLLNVFLSRTPHHVTFAEHGLQAVEMFRTHSFDLVFMDMQMPVMDGVEATRRIRAWEQEAQRSPTVIIALTADAMKEHVQRSLEAGCTAHINKPVRKEAFLREVARWEQLLSAPVVGTVSP